MNDATVRFGYDGTALNKGLADQERRLQAVAKNRERENTLARNNGQMHLQLLQAQIAGNSREATSIRRRIDLLEEMRRIQALTNVSSREAYTLASRSLALPAAGGRGRMAGIGMASMQLQDVAVQLQMGTKASTVMAQQLPQLLGAFGAGGAIVGGVVAVGGALYTMGENSKESFKKMTTEAEAFRKKLAVIKAEASSTNIGGNMDMFSERLASMRAATDSLQSLGGRLGGKISEWFMGDTSPDEKIRKTNEAYWEAQRAAADVIDASLKSSDDELKILQLKADGREYEAEIIEDQIALTREIARIEGQDLPRYAKDRLIANAQLTQELQQQSRQLERHNEYYKKRADLEKRGAERQQSREDAMAELEVLKLKARGQDSAARKLERQLSIDAEAKRLMKETGASPEQAMQIASDKAKYQARINGEGFTIGGVKNSRMMGGGLDQFHRNQLKTEIPIDQKPPPGYARGDLIPTYNAFNIAPTSMQKKGRMMGAGDGGSLSDRGKVTIGNGGQFDAITAAGKTKDNTATTLAEKLDKTNALLSRGLGVK